MLGERSGFTLTLSAIVSDQIYYDHGINLTNTSSELVKKKVKTSI